MINNFVNISTLVMVLPGVLQWMLRRSEEFFEKLIVDIVRDGDAEVSVL